MIAQIDVPTCPLCRAPIKLAVKADSTLPNGLGEISPSAFFGEEGERFIICQDGAHLHIKVKGVDRYAFLIHLSVKGE